MASVPELFQTLQANLERITEHSGPSEEPGSPASEEQIVSLETFVGAKLPEDYKAFLQLCDGWNDLGGLIKLLSIEEIISGEYNDEMEELAEEMGFARVFVLAGHLEEDSGICLVIDDDNNAFVCDIDEGVISEPSTFALLLEARKEVLLGE